LVDFVRFSLYIICTFKGNNMRTKKLVNRTVKKHICGKCKFCPCNNYSELKLATIVSEKDGGLLTDANTLVVCNECRSKIRSEEIVIDKQYPSMSGKLVLHYWMGGEEFWE
jgi:hypothetical protein